MKADLWIGRRRRLQEKNERERGRERGGEEREKEEKGGRKRQEEKDSKLAATIFHELPSLAR